MRGSGLSDYIIAILELFEAEGRTFKKEALKFGYSLGFLFVGIGLFLISIAYFLWASNTVLSEIYGQGVGALLTASLGLGLSIIFLLVARWLNK